MNDKSIKINPEYGMSFNANVSGIKTDNRDGSLKLILDVFETDHGKINIAYFRKNVQVALVLLPEDVA